MIYVGSDSVFSMKDSLLLTRFLQKYYGQKTILLIDEYNVPLDYAYRSGYYDAMVNWSGLCLALHLKQMTALSLQS